MSLRACEFVCAKATLKTLSLDSFLSVVLMGTIVPQCTAARTQRGAIHRCKTKPFPAGPETAPIKTAN